MNAVIFVVYFIDLILLVETSFDYCFMEKSKSCQTSEVGEFRAILASPQENKDTKNKLDESNGSLMKENEDKNLERENEPVKDASSMNTSSMKVQSDDDTKSKETPTDRTTDTVSQGDTNDSKKEKVEKPAGTKEKLKKTGKVTAEKKGPSAAKPEKSLEEFPKDLTGFGYKFNQDGHMVSVETGESFKFEVRKGNKKYNQKHYEALGEVITPMVYDLLIEKAQLVKHFIPVDREPEEPFSFIFASDDAFTNEEKLMVIIHGSGVVRAGQWSRSLIINDCLDSGTQLPFIKRAADEGYGIIVFNGNRNHEDDDEKKREIRGSSSPVEHGLYVWENFIAHKTKAEVIHIIAHSYGGIVTVELAKKFSDDFSKRVKKIAFTDSVHDLDTQKAPGDVRRYFTRVAVNWVSSNDPLDTPQEYGRREVKRVSAGTPKHPETSWFAYESIFKFLQDPLL